MSTPEITVRGGGVFGLSVAWACLKRGAKVRVIERRAIGAGASGGIVGALAPHTPENWNDKKQFQFDSLIMARDWWPEIEAVSGLPSGYMRTGRVQPVMDDKGLDLARARSKGAQIFWKNLAHWSVDQSAGTTWEPPSPTGWLIRDTLSAHIHPRQALSALAAAITTRGGEIILGDGEARGQVVHSTGYEGLLEIAKEMDQPVGNGVKGQAVLLNHDAIGQPQLFADALHIVPHLDGTVAIGSTSEREFDDPTSTDGRLDDILRRARLAFPVLAGAPVLARWAGIRPRAKSRAPMIGRHPLDPDAFIANGGFKIGFGMAPKVGEVMADLILEGRDTIPDSFKPEASLT
ncbi:FAD-dependent oxidoreductase [uncultured Litoreibacter sp.]|uniref:NAD(P)/FAD-dependent oxidoreductase n=1 Tax=uncultured Litoreibacter sp. TaxID=1392394 RepID=UPI00261E6F13|nr:FAD-dependent oxidoreductase [uncultured Litoreibacter sp.]